MKKKIYSFSLLLLSILLLATSCGGEKISITGISSIIIGQQTTLTAKLIEEVQTEEEIKFVWTSENPDVATVDETGVVTGVAVGETSITASYEDMTGKFEIKVIARNMANKQVLKSPEVISEDLVTGEKIEIAAFEVEAGYVESNYNPYDYSQINVYGIFTSPSGKEIVMPAFWYRDYDIEINTEFTAIGSVSGVASKDPNEIQGLETVVWRDSPLHYRLRVTLDEVGEYKYSINVEENGQLVQYSESKLTVKSAKNSNNRGIIQVDSNTNRNFVDGLGNSFIPVGVNLCWWTNSSRKTYDYDVWMEKMNENNINMARMWMATWGFSLHWGKQYNNFDDRLNQAARLDKVMNLADQNDIYIQLCFVNHGQFSSTTNAEWNKNPYNVKNGGILNSPDEFFSEDIAIKAFQNEVRYIIARYGYSDKIMAWELFNEVDWTDGAETYNKSSIYKWHRTMADYVDSIDPYNHMITTSYKTNVGQAYALNSIDFTCPHDYGYSGKNINTNLPQSMQGIIDRYKKPTMQSEVGIEWEYGQRAAELDPNGISIRQSLWAGMMGGTAGAAMQWWWDSWIHPGNLWTVFNGAGIYAEKMDLTGSMYTQLKHSPDVSVEDNAILSNENADILGYLYEDRVYGYLFHNNWWYKNPTVEDVTTDVSIKVGVNGDFTLTLYNTVTGEVVDTSTVTSTNGLIKMNITFNEDVAFILNKK